jgi:hypothetical protein
MLNRIKTYFSTNMNGIASCLAAYNGVAFDSNFVSYTR